MKPLERWGSIAKNRRRKNKKKDRAREAIAEPLIKQVVVY